jgi:predicted alpha-1,6-mannanase (GH76 family)
MGPSLSWRKQQLDYKNTPANAPLVILGARLYQITGEKQYLDYAQGAFDWLNENLVRPNGFVDDGMNRMGDKAIDNQWEFTYNQGIYIGAALELSTCHGDDEAYVELASKNATASLDMLVKDGVFKVDGDGGDEGLFKGIFYRYAGLLIDRLPEDSPIRKSLIDFTATSTDRMWANGEFNDSGAVLIGNDWNSKPSGRIYYSTELSAIMAAELRAQLETE